MEQNVQGSENLGELQRTFLREFRENRYQSRQAQHAGYGQSNTQDSANAAMFAEMTQDHSHALANLATATQYDYDTVAKMSKTIADLTLQLGQANTKLAEAQSFICKTHLKTSQNWHKIQPLLHKPSHSHVIIVLQQRHGGKHVRKIADLTLQLGQANTKLAEAQSSIATLTSKLAKTGAKSNRSSTGPTTATS